MTVGIVGLGLIGASFAKAYSEHHEYKVLAYDIDETTMDKAYAGGMIDEELTKENIKECDLILIALYPELAVKYIRENAAYIGANTMVIDCCGVKGYVCDKCYKIANENGFTFVGGHPMAGRHFSGIDYSTKTMYDGASMVLVPENLQDENTIERAKKLLSPIHFGKFTICDAERHDEMIAFTSQMAHVVSNAYVKSPTAKNHDGFSAGSYKDLTRVAWLNENMWTELFLENKEALVNELNIFIDNVTAYRDAIATENARELHDLLAEGKRCKETIDGITNN